MRKENMSITDKSPINAENVTRSLSRRVELPNSTLNATVHQIGTVVVTPAIDDVHVFADAFYDVVEEAPVYPSRGMSALSWPS